ncbi:MAG: tetratricopeptide repeat protein [bacterium]
MKVRLSAVVMVLTLLAGCSVFGGKSQFDSQAERDWAHIGQMSDQGQYVQAAQGYEAYLQQYPDTPYRSLALYFKGKNLLAAGQKDAAVQLFNKVKSDYPGSTAAILADEQLRKL